MQNLFRIAKSYRIKHKILKVLYEDWEETNTNDRIVGSIRVASKTKIPIEDINRWHPFLVSEGEITTSENNGQYMMSIQQSGKNSYVERKYIKLGRKEKWDGIYNWGRIIIPLAALLLALITFISNREQKDRIRKLEKQIQQK